MPDYTCMCNEGVLETRECLFFNCPFAKACWKNLRPNRDTSANQTPLECIAYLKQQPNKPFFMELIMLGAWAIWKTRNAFIFQGVRANLYRCGAL
jgi:hypothetical protein